MPFDGSGNFSRVMDWTDDAAANIKIKADRHDQNDDDIAAGLSKALTRDGQSQVTADISFNGHKLTNVGTPTQPNDAVNKAYADAIRAFATSLEISGNDTNGRIKFLGTGVTGIEWAATDLGFGVRETVAGTSWPRWVWNDKADMTGTDQMVLTDQGQLGVGVAPPVNAGSGIYSQINTTISSHAINAYWSNADNKWHFLTAGWASLYTMDKSTGVTAIYRSSATGAADAVVTWTGMATWNASGQVTFASTAFVGPNGAYFNIDGNIVGSIWTGYGGGYNDAYSAINARIESRCKAHIDAYAVTDTRMAGFAAYNHTTSGAGPLIEYSGYVITASQKTGGDNFQFYYRQPQRYITSQGWAVAFAF